MANPLQDRVRELVDKNINAGDLDDLAARISVVLDDERIEASGVGLMNAVVDSILEKFEDRLDDIPEPLLINLLEHGHLTRSEDAGLSAMLERLTNDERAVVATLEGHLSGVQRTTLIVGLQTGSSPITARVLATLSWYGLQALNMILDEAATRLLEAKIASEDAGTSSFEEAYEMMWAPALFFPDDPDEFDLEGEDEKAKRRDTESTMLVRVNFLKSANKPTSGTAPKFPRR